MSVSLPRRPRPDRRAPRLGGGWLLVPNALWTLAFFVAPLAIILVFAFSTRGIYGDVVFRFSTANFRGLTNDVYVGVILRSLAMAAGATLGCALLGYPLAYYLVFKSRRRNLLLLLLMVPFWTSLLVRSYAWMIILNDKGLLNDALSAVGLPAQNVLYHWPAIVIGIVYAYLPLMVFPLVVALDRVDRVVLDAARDLGARNRRVFLRVTLPLSLPGLVAGTLLVGIPATGEYLIPALLGGGRQLMVGNLIANEFLDAQNWPLGAAISIAMMVILLALVGLFLRSPANRQATGSVL